MPTYDFKADVSNFLAGMRKIETAYNSISTKAGTTAAAMQTKFDTLKNSLTPTNAAIERLGNLSNTAATRIKTGMVGVAPAFTAVRQAASQYSNTLINGSNNINKTLGVTNTAVNRLSTTTKTFAKTVNTAFPTMTKNIQTLNPAFASISQNADKFARAIQTATKTQNQKNMQSMTTHTKNWNNALTSLYHTAIKISTIFSSGMLLGKALSLSVDYIETINLFDVTMGAATEAAQKFVDTMASGLGVDPVELMKMQGIFNVLAKSIGVGTKNANTMSQGLSQVAIDMASLRNMDISEVQSKLESGIVGYSRAVRDLGIDVSLNGLENEALLEGLKVNVRTLDQQSKMQLRYNAIMRQSTLAQGDFARTSMQPANQLRIMRNQLTIAARELGNVFLPALAAVIPYITAFARFLAIVFRQLALLGGFGAQMKLAADNALKAAGGIKTLGDEMDDLTDGTEEADAANKALARTIQGFDELNIVGKQNTGGALGSSIGAGLQGLDLDLQSYDMGFDGLIQKSEELLANILAIWEQFKQSDAYATIVSILGKAWDIIKVAAQAAWDVISGVFNFIVDNATWTLPLLAGIGTFFVIVDAVMGIVNAAKLAFTAVGILASGPVGWAILGIAALGGLIVFLELIPDDIDKINAKMGASVGKITPWADEYSKAKGTITDVKDIISKTGETLETIDAKIATTEKNISDTLKKAKDTNNTTMGLDLMNIRQYLLKLSDLETQKLELYALNADAVAKQIEYQMKTNTSMTDAELAELQKQLDNAYAQIDEARAAAKTTEIAAAINYWRDIDDANGSGLKRAMDTIESKYREMEWGSQSSYDIRTQQLIDFNDDTARLHSGAYQDLAGSHALITAENDRYAKALETAQEKQKNDHLGFTDFVGAVEDEHARKLQLLYKGMEQDFSQLQSDRDNTYLSMIANSVEHGGTLSAQEKENVEAILMAYAPLTPGMETASRDALMALTKGFGDTVGLTNAASMTGTQALNAIYASLGITPDGKSLVLESLGGMIDDGIALGMHKGYGHLTTAAAGATSTIIDELKKNVNATNGASAVGNSIIDGIVAAMNKGKTDLEKAANGAATTIIDELMQNLDAHSPSKKMMTIGEYIVQGLAKGINDSSKLVNTAIDNLPMPNTDMSYSLKTNYGFAGTPRSTSVGTSPTSSPAMNEESLYRAVSRAVREMPLPILNIDGEPVAVAVNSANKLLDRRYNR